jgi:hypothetical protein
VSFLLGKINRKVFMQLCIYVNKSTCSDTNKYSGTIAGTGKADGSENPPEETGQKDELLQDTKGHLRVTKYYKLPMILLIPSCTFCMLLQISCEKCVYMLLINGNYIQAQTMYLQNFLFS